MSFQVAGQPVELSDDSLAGHGIYDSDTNERVGTVVREPGGIWRLQSMSDQPLPPRQRDQTGVRDRVSVEPSETLACLDHGHHKLLGRITRQGIHLFCRICRTERLIPWATVDWFRRQLVVTESERSTYQQLGELAEGEILR